jgi:LmbE family N-acetylglucosaminyl deacetylase
LITYLEEAITFPYLSPMLHANKILILAPHTDDGELGCGASIAKYIASGKQVTYIAFSSCPQSLPPGLAPDTLLRECRAATAKLGISDVRFFDFEVRQFPALRQQILEELVALGKELQPDVVFVPARNDVHQDHQVIYAEALRGFKRCAVVGYELPWNNLQFAPVYFEKLEEQQVTTKEEALGFFRSQTHRPYMEPGFMKSLARVRGMQCGTTYAEAFEVYRLYS